MNAESLLIQIGRGLAECRLEAILIGNAAAALHGAPVTTLDFDFMFQKTPANLRKLKALARKLGGQILKPYYPLSGLYRLMMDERGLQLDFMSSIHGVKSFSSLRSRASPVSFGAHSIWVADLNDIIRSKRALGRPRIWLRCRFWKRPNMRKLRRKRSRKEQILESLRKENDRAMVDQIRRLLALPMNKRTHFLRVRLPFGGSSL